MRESRAMPVASAHLPWRSTRSRGLIPTTIVIESRDRGRIPKRRSGAIRVKQFLMTLRRSRLRRGHLRSQASIGLMATVLLIGVAGCQPVPLETAPTVSGASKPEATAAPVIPTAPPAPSATAAPTETPRPAPSPTASLAVRTVEPTAPAIPTPLLPARASEWTPPQAPGAAPFYVHGDPATKTVALTFDMGIADSGSLKQILETLRKHNAHSTFFVTGAWAKAQPEMLKAVLADGHELANHTVTHPDLTKLSHDEIVDEMEQTEKTVQRIVGRTTKPYMRPPFGAYDSRLLKVLGDLHYEVIYWTLDSTDWRTETTGPSVTKRVIDNTRAGDIVVFHGYVPKTAQAMPAIISALYERGLRVGTVSAALGRAKP